MIEQPIWFNEKMATAMKCSYNIAYRQLKFEYFEHEKIFPKICLDFKYDVQVHKIVLCIYFKPNFSYDQTESSFIIPTIMLNCIFNLGCSGSPRDGCQICNIDGLFYRKGNFLNITNCGDIQSSYNRNISILITPEVKNTVSLFLEAGIKKGTF